MITIVLRFMVPVEKKRRFGTSVSKKIQKRSLRSTWIKMSHIRSQRKRWTSNAITGYFFLLTGTNIPFHVKILASIDLFRIHTCVTRLVSTALLMAHITDLQNIQIIMMVLVFGIPYFFFFYYALKLKRYGLFLLAGSVVSKVASPFITVYNFLYCVYHFTDISWGLAHGAVNGEKIVSVTEDYPVKEDDPETLV